MLLELLKNVAPGLATAVGGPMAGMAVKAIADKLGCAPDEQSVANAIQMDPSAAMKLAEIDLKQFELENQDRANARDREIKLATSESAPVITKVVTPVIALGVLVLSFALFGVLVFIEVRPEAKDILIYVLGVLSSAVTQILSYYFGSSQGSKDKSEALARGAK